ncbi:MAG TPA: NAD(P)-dependent oxidoreductase [Sphingomicrobium sp.]|nr:NAD(P)-dependent oxidoreductase [Sphingomicrobium sp.]
MDVGVIGMGHMGAGIVASLLDAGHKVTVYNRTRAKAEPLGAKGAIIAESIAEACSAGTVLTMLANDEAVENTAFGKGGILESLAKGAIHVSSSTISVALSDRLTKAHRERGQRYVAATVLGRPDVAAAGELFVVAAGAADAIADVRPLFGAFGRSTTQFGETPSAANLVKLSANFLFATVFESLGEAVALVDRGGIDKHKYLEFLTTSAFSAPAYKTYGALIVADTAPPVGFAAPLGFKDIRLALRAAEDLRVAMPFASVLHDRFVELLAHGGEKMDWSAVGRMSRWDGTSSEGDVKMPATTEAMQ